MIGLNVDEPARVQLSCIAAAGGGNYLDANTSEELLSALEQVQEQIILDAENEEAEPAALFDGQIAYIGPDMNIYVYRGDEALLYRSHLMQTQINNTNFYAGHQTELNLPF